MSDETRKKIADKQRQTPGMQGKHHSEDTKKKISEKTKGRKMSLEFKEKIRLSWIKRKLNNKIKEEV